MRGVVVVHTNEGMEPSQTGPKVIIPDPQVATLPSLLMPDRVSRSLPESNEIIYLWGTRYIFSTLNTREEFLQDIPAMCASETFLDLV